MTSNYIWHHYVLDTIQPEQLNATANSWEGYSRLSKTEVQRTNGLNSNETKWKRIVWSNWRNTASLFPFSDLLSTLLLCLYIDVCLCECIMRQCMCVSIGIWLKYWVWLKFEAAKQNALSKDTEPQLSLDLKSLSSSLYPVNELIPTTKLHSYTNKH